MPYRLNLPKRLRERGWKVKIQDKERVEPPHVTIWHLDQVWRLNLRLGEFMVPPGGHWREIDAEVRELIEANWEVLGQAWDAMYPHNPLRSPDEEDDD